MTKKYVQALRLPFITVTVFPFLFGSFISKEGFNFVFFLLGLMSAVCMHLGANLINDYADSKSGVDWQDKRYYNFFGGSKLIQEGVFKASFYLKNAVFYFIVSFVCILAVAFLAEEPVVIPVYLTVLFLGVSYTAKPLKFSYRMLGEIIVFVLFGPVLVAGGYFLQTHSIFDIRTIVLSLPFAFFTTAILFANEIPDFHDDMTAKKITLVKLLGQKNSFVLYYILAFAGFVSVGLGIVLNFIGLFSIPSFLAVFIVLKAGRILQVHYSNKLKLVESSKLTILAHALVSLFLILGIIL